MKYSWKDKKTRLVIVWGGLIGCIIPVILALLIAIPSPIKLPDNSDWIGFLAGYFGAVIGGAFIFLGIRFEILEQKKERFKESYLVKIKCIDEIISIIDEQITELELLEDEEHSRLDGIYIQISNREAISILEQTNNKYKRTTELIRENLMKIGGKFGNEEYEFLEVILDSEMEKYFSDNRLLLVFLEKHLDDVIDPTEKECEENIKSLDNLQNYFHALSNRCKTYKGDIRKKFLELTMNDEF